MRKPNLVTAVFAFLATTLIASVAFAVDGAPSNELDVKMSLAIASGFGIAIAAFGGALGQSKAAASALEGIARNPAASGKIFVPMLLGLAFIESLVIFTWVISFFLFGQIG